MTKNLLFAVLGTLIIVSCGQGTKQNKEATTEDQEMVFEQIVLDTLIEKAEGFIDKNVAFEGMVTHVCKHGGQKLFAFGSNDEASMKITVGENYSEFPIELEGSTIKFKGILKEQRIDETYLAEWETEVNAPKEEQAEEAVAEEVAEMEEGEDNHDHHATEKGHEKTQEDLEKIAKLRKKIEESEKGYLSNFSVECVSYEVIEEAEAVNEVAEQTEEEHTME